ncbi:MAG: primosomal protein N' [Deltaproteobacteria bacterium]|nr:primosomal protein N' [Deltaproteobacteria bacterium]
MSTPPSSCCASNGCGKNPKGDAREGEIVEIAVCLPVEGTFHYRLPSNLEGVVGPGWRVLVPFGKREVTGRILDFCDAPRSGELRDVLRPLDDMPLIPPTLFPFFAWISRYYMCPLGEAIRTALTGGTQVASRRTVRPTDEGLARLKSRNLGGRRKRVLIELEHLGEVPLNTLARRIGLGSGLSGLVSAMEHEGLVQIETSVRSPKAKPRRVKALRFVHWPVPENPALTPRQTQVLSYIRDKYIVSFKELKSEERAGASILRRLVQDGLVEEEWIEEYRRPHVCDGFDKAPPAVLTQPQEAAVEAVLSALERGGFAAFLLHGVTGSGKTEVYIRAAARSLEQGRQVLVLVPEISLTPQLVGRFRGRFGEQVAVLHSGLTQAERYDEWRRIKKGEASLVIGARSAIFAPLVKPGLIVADEEHDSSFKQEERLRYNARDLALVRGQMEGAVVILGSATPSMESLANTYRGKMNRIVLPERIAHRPLPTVTLVDMREEPIRPGDPRMISGLMRETLELTLAEGNQAMLFLNRRGFAHFLLCLDCGQALQCPNCSITLTHHQAPATLRCHYCGHIIPVPQFCPNCASIRLRPLGGGTQRVVEEISHLFPGARIARMDRDTTRGRGSHGRILQQLATGKADLLVGTQMIAKGHDFPGVTLVGVLLADLSLNLPDFRAAERTFQILTQVSGRAGRGDRPGQVIIQTYNPEHYCIQAARDNDIDGFYRRELAHREALGYPPAGHLILLRFSGIDPKRVEEAARGAKSRLAGHKGVQVLGPAPAPLSRLKGKYRWNLLLKSPQRELLRKAARQLMKDLPRRVPLSGVQLALDVDPQNLM